MTNNNATQSNPSGVILFSGFNQRSVVAMGISGEVITRPFTFVPITHALFWNNIRPIFVDIEHDHYTLDPKKLKQRLLHGNLISII